MRCHTFVCFFLAIFSWPMTTILVPEFSPPDPSVSHCKWEETMAKDLDIVLYGATGYTGKLAAYYIAEGHPELRRWAIAGRQALKVNYIKSRIANASNLESIIVGLKNEAGLVKMAKRARAIVSFAGPYEQSGGESLIRAAMEGCAHYVDISTETFWKANMLKKYGPVAAARGVAIVQSAGFASLASDFLAMAAIQDVVKLQQEPPSNVMVVWTKYNGALSGGQIATKKSEMAMHGVLNNAYILAPDTAEDKKVDWTIDGLEEYGVHEGLGMLSKSNLASFDCPVIRRSIATKFPGSAISVQMAAKASMFVEQTMFLGNQSRNQWEGTVPTNPLPGEGPPRWVRQYGSFAGMAIASGRWTNGDGKKEVKHARITLKGNGDPSSIGSAIMATEVALGLASHGPDGHSGGYLTPALALGARVLEERLTAVKGGQFMTVTHA